MVIFECSAYIHKYIHTCMHIYMCVSTYTIYTYIHTFVVRESYLRYTCTYIHTQIHTLIQSNINTYLRTYIHTYIHTYTHVHTGSIGIIIEFMDKGSLEFMLNKDIKVSETVMAAITFQIIWGLGYLHFENQIHRDVKPANILMVRSIQLSCH